jgi:hypothetical protein
MMERVWRRGRNGVFETFGLSLESDSLIVSRFKDDVSKLASSAENSVEFVVVFESKSQSTRARVEAFLVTGSI